MGIAKKCWSALGILAGTIIMYYGAGIRNLGYGVWQDMTVAFGGDFYTYSYEAAARAANNVQALAKIVQNGFSDLIMALGGLGILYFGYRLLSEFSQAPTPASEIMQTKEEKEEDTICAEEEA